MEDPCSLLQTLSSGRRAAFRAHAIFVRQESTTPRQKNVPLPFCCLNFANAALTSLILLFWVNTPQPKELLQLSLLQGSSRHNQHLILFHPQIPTLPQHTRPKRDSKNLYGCFENLEGMERELLDSSSYSTWTLGSRAKRPSEHTQLPAERSHQPLCQLSTLSWVMDGDRQTGAPLGNLAQLSWTHADLWTPAFL